MVLAFTMFFALLFVVGCLVTMCVGESIRLEDEIDKEKLFEINFWSFSCVDLSVKCAFVTIVNFLMFTFGLSFWQVMALYVVTLGSCVLYRYIVKYLPRLLIWYWK